MARSSTLRAPAELPSSIKVGHRNLSVVLVEDDTLGDARGDFHNYRARIRVSNALIPADQAETMLHEILHACWSVGSAIPSQYEEIAVEMLAGGLAQIWADNPQLIGWISNNLRRQS
jgi:hypothetical protein